ncbi:hypothetical protein IHN32_04390 [Deinococcus sp. 14RED07]|uniref:PD-(D/E)XK nuclease domain-containing protein n=1 Tax=Deinococcus sp. 14RED07 TaxID=2745874 RepID=UPI001E3D2A93|nr:hypothetical protein [Deinococcus sp. 14RED07]MCD0175187.1 hypothetical protein [Deinococcus sp. 14RED07]
MTAENNRYDLQQLIRLLSEHNPQINSIHIFGSRAYKTGSIRSDCDLLLTISDGVAISDSKLRQFALEHCEFLDFFIMRSGHARSCINDSYIYASSNEILIEKLDAIQIWEKESGFKETSVDWIFETHPLASPIQTTLPNAAITEVSWQGIRKRTEDLGLPIYPFIGDNLRKATGQIIKIASEMILSKDSLTQRGSAKNGWTVNPQSEYDCQNLFFTVVKPWLPDLSKEQIAIYYDGQEKISDFSLFRETLIIEMKYINSEDKKREVVKTLAGLREFYTRNGNVRILLFLIYAKKEVGIDIGKWESDFTYATHTPEVITKIIVIE